MTDTTPTPEEIKASEIEDVVREWSRRGKPENGALLRQLFEAGDEIPSYLLDFAGLRPEKDSVGKLELPPRTGPGSGKKAWAEFAAKVSDLDDAVLSKMNRDEIVDILETRGIIPAAGEEGDIDPQANKTEDEENAALAANE